MHDALIIHNLSVVVEEKKVLKNLNLAIQAGKIHVLMGPNGSGKSSLAHTIIGNPRYTITEGDIVLHNESIVGLSPDKRAKKGLFLSFQYPPEIPGVKIFTFLKEAHRALTGQDLSITEFNEQLLFYMNLLQMDPAYAQRNLNDGFSGGERKKLEVLQVLLLQPKILFLDEIDSGLDIDALKIIADALLFFRKQNPQTSFVLITHYQRILRYIQPDYVHVMLDGTIIQSGDKQLAELIEEQGYDAYSWPNK